MRLFHSGNYSFGLMLLMLLTALMYTDAFADSVKASTNADEGLPEPHKIIQNITSSLLLVINDEKLDPVRNPDEFYRRATTILDPVVAFGYIANGVMGNHAERVTPEQRLKFTEAFKKGLVSTYSKGISGFSDSVNITTLQPEVDVTGQRKISVVQKVISDGTTTYISYTMAQNRDNQWKLINVVLNGVNLGKTFRGQFAQAVQNNQGSVTTVIDNWGKDG